MEQIARRLAPSKTWTYIGGVKAEAQPVELVLRAFEGDLLAATGEEAGAPGTEITRIRVGGGARLTGRHFFVRPAGERDGCLFSFRGL